MSFNAIRENKINAYILALTYIHLVDVPLHNNTKHVIVFFTWIHFCPQIFYLP